MNGGIADAGAEKAEVEEETERLREGLDEAVKELETLKTEYDALMQKRLAQD